MTLNRKRLVRIQDQLDDYFFEVNKDVPKKGESMKNFILDVLFSRNLNFFDLMSVITITHLIATVSLWWFLAYFVTIPFSGFCEIILANTKAKQGDNPVIQ